MTRFNWHLCGGLGKILSQIIIFTFNSIAYQQTVIAPVEYIPGFAVFVQYRESNAVNSEHFTRMFPPNIFDLIASRCILMCVISLFIISDSK